MSHHGLCRYNKGTKFKNVLSSALTEFKKIAIVLIVNVCPLLLVVYDTTASILHRRRRNGTKMGLYIMFQLITNLIYNVLPVCT